MSDQGWGNLIFIAVIGYFLFLFPTSWENAVWYAVKYKVGMDKVITDTKPKDCDFMHAPLGAKGCSYEAQVNVYNAAGVLVDGDNAPKYGRDTKTGRPILSFDGGKSWDWYDADTVPDRKAASVEVFWIKKTE
jgi:hypothetical protein